MERDLLGRFVNGHRPYKVWLGKKRGPTPNCIRKKISKALSGKKKNIQHKRNISLAQKGRNNSMWKGGRHKDISGYWIIKQPNHPNADVSGYVREHHLVIERQLGRSLKSGEIVHHINYNRGNNELSNLCLLTKREHSRLHSGVHKLIANLYKEEIIKFNERTKKYEKA